MFHVLEMFTHGLHTLVLYHRLLFINISIAGHNKTCTVYVFHVIKMKKHFAILLRLFLLYKFTTEIDHRLRNLGQPLSISFTNVYKSILNLNCYCELIKTGLKIRLKQKIKYYKHLIL